jgi:hypothetical protein
MSLFGVDVAGANQGYLNIPEQKARAADLWPVLIEHAAACARASGERDRATVVGQLGTDYGFRFGPCADLGPVIARLAEAAYHALDDIKDHVGGEKLARTAIIDEGGQLSPRPNDGDYAIYSKLYLRNQRFRIAQSLSWGADHATCWLHRGYRALRASRTYAQYREIVEAVQADLPPTGKSPICLSSPICKNSPLPVLPKSSLEPSPSRALRGAFRDRHGRRARDAVDAAASGAQVIAGRVSARERSNGELTNGDVAYGKTVWSWHPLLVLNPRRLSRPDRARTSLHPRMTVTRRIRRRGEHEIRR